LHKIIADKIESFLPPHSLIRDEACGGRQRIPLFNTAQKSRKTEYCNVDLLVLKQNKIKMIVEIEESNVKPTQICGKFLTSALANYYIHTSEKNEPIGMDDSVTFIQIVATSKLVKEKTSKPQQWKLLEESINSVIPPKEQQDYIVQATDRRQAGCIRTFFGIESGNNAVLTIMKKNATVEQARDAVNVAKQSRIQVGAFFIVGYPGETEGTVLDTVNFASSLPLDYLSFTMPYPIQGTPLYERVRDRMAVEEWEEPKNPRLIKHNLLFQSPLSEAKLRFAIAKGMTQFYIRKYLRSHSYMLIGQPFEHFTDFLLKRLR